LDDSSRTDVAVVGAGAAGLDAAIVAAAEGARVALVSRSPLAQTASYWAQGGIAAALADDDSPEQHAQDTIAAARDAARASAVRVLCEESPARVRDLQELGVQFDADRNGNLALGLEGPGSSRRPSSSRCSSPSRRARWRYRAKAVPASPSAGGRAVRSRCRHER
jgi:L-aspartate oxidase